MSDLINRVEVREFIKSYSHSTDVVYHMVKHLYEVPTIDAVPVVHGEWVWDDTKCIYRCSMCKSPKARDDMDRKIIKEQMFCHVCGALMDGERREG